MVCEKKQVPGSAGKVAANFLTLPTTSTTRTFVSLSRDVYRGACSQPLLYIQLKFVKSMFVLIAVVSELIHQDWDSQCIIAPLGAQSCSSRFSEFSNLEPGKHWGTVSYFYTLPCKYQEVFWLLEDCFETAWSHRIQPVTISSPLCTMWSVQIRSNSSVKHLLALVFVGAQKTSPNTHNGQRRRRQREVCQLSANRTACSRTVASKELSVACVLTIEFICLLKRSIDLNKDFI